jgi:hypothetical protein
MTPRNIQIHSMDDSSALQTVYQLYDLQNQLIEQLEKRSWTQNVKDDMKKKIKELSTLLQKVRNCCKGYVGGDDVFEAIEQIQADVKKRIGDM